METKNILITPEMAKKWLDKNNDNNRNYRDRYAIYLSNEMKEGRWKIHTGESLKFTENGQLMDGQHRLSAIVKSNLSFLFRVDFNIDNSVFDVIDTGVKRSAADVLGIHGVASATNVAAIINMVLRYDHIGYKSKTNVISNQSVLNTYKSDTKNWDEITRYSLNIYSDFGTSIISPSLLGYWVYHLDRNNKYTSRLFFDTLKDGGGNPKSPTKLLRKLYYQNAINKGDKFSARKKSALLVKAFNSFVKGKEKTVLFWNPDNEKFPLINN